MAKPQQADCHYFGARVNQPKASVLQSRSSHLGSGGGAGSLRSKGRSSPTVIRVKNFYLRKGLLHIILKVHILVLLIQGKIWLISKISSPEYTIMITQAF